MSSTTELENKIKQAFLSIWNDRMAGSVYSLYLYNCRIFQGVNYDHIFGRENYLSRIVETFSVIPDLSFEIENCFTCDNGKDDAVVYLRWNIEGTHLGAGYLGAPTGKRISFSGMNVCHLKNGMIFEQYDVHDNGNLLDQLGVDETCYLEGLYIAPPLFQPCYFGETGRVAGQDIPPCETVFDTADGIDENYLRKLLNEIWNRRSPGIISRTHSDDCIFLLPGTDEILGNGDYTEFVFSMISSFPDMKIYIDEVISNLKTKSDGDVAVRCTLQGFHGGVGRYGDPVNRQVTIPLIIEYHFEKNKVKSERLCMSEFDLIKSLFSYRRRENIAVEDYREESTAE